MVWMSQWWFDPWRSDENRVLCPRNDRMKRTSEHLLCPFCFGTAEDIAAGRRDRFCDYDPKTDPISFGFPEDGSHIRCN